MPPLGIADGLMEFNTPQATGTLLEKTRPPCFVMWSLSATAIVAMHSCAPTGERVPDNPRGDDSRGPSAICVAGEEPTFYEFGDIPCARDVRPSKRRRTHGNPLQGNGRERDGSLRLRLLGTSAIRGWPRDRNATAQAKTAMSYWSETPFVRIRRQQYLADLDGDGHLEFAVFPLSPRERDLGHGQNLQHQGQDRTVGLGTLAFRTGHVRAAGLHEVLQSSAPEECEKCR